MVYSIPIRFKPTIVSLSVGFSWCIKQSVSVLGSGNTFGGREYMLCSRGISSVSRVGLLLSSEVLSLFISTGTAMPVMASGKLIREKNNNQHVN